MAATTATSPLQNLKKHLHILEKKSQHDSYTVPGLWVSVGSSPESLPVRKVNPGKFFLEHVTAVEDHALKNIAPEKSLNSQLSPGTGGNWISQAVIYNLFVRLSTAFDHNQDGKLGGTGIDPTLNSGGIRETGTFLKSIALLGHIKKLGATVIHLLPVTSIGRDGNKGNLGSPYAIRNPYVLEKTLADPLLELSVEDQFKAFIEACHLLGIRVICEFVFRTASKDSDWIPEHPDWFYWIDAAIQDRSPGENNLDIAASHYGNPIFDESTLLKVKSKIAHNDFTNLPPPPLPYRNFFKRPPAPESVRLNDRGQYRGMSPDPLKSMPAKDGQYPKCAMNGALTEGVPATDGQYPQSFMDGTFLEGVSVETRIPGAFADWPPDDNQPPWGDVTYLRMYLEEDQKNPRFNYIAYNTIRMYDEALANDHLANRPLWDKIRDLIPYYQHNYGIDGVMVDMGHAVPVRLMREIVDTARGIDPDFAFLSENFSIDESSVRAGYNAVVGYAWWVEYHRQGLHDLLCHVGIRGVPLPYFGAVENHNTPRAASRPGGEAYARYAFLLNCLLPKAIPFIHSGFELGETNPVNTGLDFKNEDLKRLEGTPLALFDIAGFSWKKADPPMLAFTRRVLEIRQTYAQALNDQAKFVRLETGHPDLFAFLRQSDGKTLMVLLNRDLDQKQTCLIALKSFIPAGTPALENLLAGVVPQSAASLPIEGDILKAVIRPGECFALGW